MQRTLIWLSMVAFAPFSIVGCNEKSTVTRETKVSTPSGTTTTTTEQTVEKSGDHPPPAQP